MSPVCEAQFCGGVDGLPGYTSQQSLSGVSLFPFTADDGK